MTNGITSKAAINGRLQVVKALSGVGNGQKFFSENGRGDY
jgi:hypothetical protein